MFTSSPRRARSSEHSTEEPNDIPFEKWSPERQIQTLYGPEWCKWGWVIFRCTYNPELDRCWGAFKDAIYEKTRKIVAESDAPDIADKLEWTFMEDPRLEGASLDELKRRFKEFARAESVVVDDYTQIPWGSRYRFFLQVDEESLRSMSDPGPAGLRKGHVKLVRACWENPAYPDTPETNQFDEVLEDEDDNEDCMEIDVRMISPEFFMELENEEDWWLFYGMSTSLFSQYYHD